MSKIGILTFHNNHNKGSILQAYCLHKCLQENHIGNEVEIVDYRTTSFEIKRIWSVTPSQLITKLRDFFTFENFFYSHGGLSKEKIVTNNHKKAINFLKTQDYDMVIVGSDTVWRLDKGIFARPFPNAYFLDPDLDSLKVSYAASSSLTDYENLSEIKTKLLKKHLSSFDKISVRDKHTENFLKYLDITDFERVPDPTFLVELPQKDLTNILTDNGISINKPIMVMNQCRKFSKVIAEHFKKEGYQIVSLYKSMYSDFDLLGEITPLEYYSIHQHFDFVVSGSLHSTIFSIKNGTPFATLDFSPTHLIDKKESLLEDFSLLNRHIKISEVKSKDDVIESIEKCENDLEKNHVEKKLEKLNRIGLNYIMKLKDMFHEKIKN